MSKPDTMIAVGNYPLTDEDEPFLVIQICSTDANDKATVFLDDDLEPEWRRKAQRAYHVLGDLLMRTGDKE